MKPAAKGLFVVIEGRVRVVRETVGRGPVVHEEGPGGTLGEVPPAVDLSRASDRVQRHFVHVGQMLPEGLEVDPGPVGGAVGIKDSDHLGHRRVRIWPASAAQGRNQQHGGTSPPLVPLEPRIHSLRLDGRKGAYPRRSLGGHETRDRRDHQEVGWCQEFEQRGGGIDADPKTERVETVALPTRGAVVRHMVNDPGAKQIWLALSRTGLDGTLDDRECPVLERCGPVPYPCNGKRGSMASQKEMDFTYSLIDRMFRLSIGEFADYSGAMYDGDFSLTLEEAQHRKHEYIARHLGIGPGTRMLDLSCGWGPLLTHVKSLGRRGSLACRWSRAVSRNSTRKRPST